MIQLLAASHHISPTLVLDTEAIAAVLESATLALSNAARGTNLLMLGAALDYCTLVRYLV